VIATAISSSRIENPHEDERRVIHELAL
jgi:hypothetical protein